MPKCAPKNNHRTPEHRPNPANGGPNRGEKPCCQPPSGLTPPSASHEDKEIEQKPRFVQNVFGNLGGFVPPRAQKGPKCSLKDQLLHAEVPSKSGQWRPDWRRKNMLEKSPRHSEQAEMQRTEKEFLEIRCFETAFCLESGRNLPGNFTGSGRYFDVRKLVSGATFWPNLGPWGPQTTPENHKTHRV